MKFLSDILAKAGLTVDGVVTLNNTATGQTPNANDNSTKLATTAWVRTFVQPYSLPIASASILGGVKVGSGLSINSSTGVLSVVGASAASIKSTQTFVVTEGQTVFTVTGGYTPGLIDIFLNGVYLSPNQTVATNGTTFTINDPAATGDVVDVIVASAIFEGSASTTDQLPEGVVNLYYTNARARAAITLTTTGVSGAATYNSSTGVFNIPNYQGLVPAGGVAGDILAKVSGTNYDVTWIPNFTSTVQHTVKAAVAVTKGQAVYVSSADGTNMIVSKASNATEGTSSKTLGLVAQDLAINGQGFVVTEGLLAGLNTSTANAGDPVWLGTNGNLIFGLLNKPTAPAHLVFIGIVTRVQSNNGEIFVKVQNGFELDELHDLSVKNPTDGDMIKYVASTGLWTKIAATTTNITEGTNLYYTQARFDTAFAAKSTTNLAEGTNLYYTNARARAAISVTGSGSYDSATGVITVTGGVTSVNTLTGAVTLTTTNIGEGTNLYYTTARVNSDFDTRLATKSTTNLAEGTNLYYTTARVNSDFDTRLATKSTTNLAEGTNLYYTDARVGTYLTNNSYATQSYVSTQINNLVSGAPGLLDTLDELAAALGDDPNFATTVSTALSNRLRIDIGTQGLTSTQQGYGRTNLGLGSLATLSSVANAQITDVAWSKVTGAPAFITGYTEVDTLASVTGRGASTSTTLNLDGRVNIGNGLTRPSALNSDSVAHARIGGSDVHLYVASLGAGGGYKVAVQAARTSDFASFDLDLQSNGGTLRYGGNEIATRTWVTSQSYLTGITSNQVTTALGYTPWNFGNIDAARNIVSGTNLDTDLENGGAYSSYGAGGTSWNAPFSYGGVIGFAFTSGIRAQFGFDIRHTASDYGDLWYRTKNNVGYSTWRTMLHSANYSSYALPLSGGILSGPLTINTTGDIVANGETFRMKGGGGSAEFIWYRNYSGSPSEPGFVINNRAGNTTFSHNANGGGTGISGNFTAGGNISAANFSGSSSGTNTGDQTNISGLAGSETLSTVTGRGASTSTALSINNNVTITSGRLIVRTGGANTYGIVSGYDNNNHMMTMRGSISGSTSSPTITGAHQMTFVEYADAGDTSGWYFKSSNTGTYEEIAKITRTGITVLGKFVTSISSGTMFSHGAMSDAIGYNGSYGTYIGSVVGGTYYIYGNGTFFDNGSIRTLIHSGNIGSQSVNYATQAGTASNANSVGGFGAGSFFRDLGFEGGGANANTISETRSAFTYAVNAPWNGLIAYFGASGYGLQLNSQYQGTGLSFRSRNGDNATWNAWSTVIHSNNIGSQSVAYASSAGTANGVAWTNVSGRPSALSQFSNDSGYITSSGSISGSAGSAGTITGRSKGSFTVGGNVNTFYPVAFQIGSGSTGEQGISVLQIERGGYDEPGYSNYTFSTFHCRIRAKADGWGFGASYIQVEANAYTTPMLADVTQQNQTSQLIVWLRGGCAYRWYDVEGSWGLNFSNPSGTSYSTFNGNSVYGPTSTNTIGGNFKYQQGWGNNYISGTLTAATAANIGSLMGGSRTLNVSYSIGVRANLTGTEQEIFNVGNTGSGQNDGYFRLLDNGNVKVLIGANASRSGDNYINNGGKFTYGGDTHDTVFRINGNSGASGFSTSDMNNILHLSRNSHSYILFSSPDGFDQGLHFVNTTANAIVGRIAYQHSSGGLLSFSVSSAIRLQLNSSGTLTASGDIVAYGSPSDSRLKTIKSKVDNAVEKVSKLNGYYFDWNEVSDLAKIKEDVGVIAQEVADVFPELARTNNDGFMSVRYQGLTAVLIEAVKEQQSQIESQKSEIEELKDLVKQLINR